METGLPSGKYKEVFLSLTLVKLTFSTMQAVHVHYLGTCITMQELVKEVAIAAIYLQFCIYM